MPPPSTDTNLPSWLRHAGGPARRGSGARAPRAGVMVTLALLLFAAGGGAGYLVALRRMPRPSVAAAAPACPPAGACADPAPRSRVGGGGAASALLSRPAQHAKAGRGTPAALVPLPERKPLDEGERTRALRAFATNRAPELRDCLDEPDRGPPLELGAAFEIGANGAVELVQILGVDGAPTEVRRCYSRHLKKWRFPEELLRGEEKLLVNFVL